MTTYEIELEKTNANQEFDIVIDEIENSIHILLQTGVRNLDRIKFWEFRHER